MEKKQSRFAAVGIALGAVALLLALTHFWAGPFSPQPTLETVVAEKAAAIRSAALDALQGKEPAEETFTTTWNLDNVTEVVTAIVGGLAVILAVVGFASKEPSRIAGGAAALGVSAIAFSIYSHVRNGSAGGAINLCGTFELECRLNITSDCGVNVACNVVSQPGW